jgi:hypothetical protein
MNRPKCIRLLVVMAASSVAISAQFAACVRSVDPLKRPSSAEAAAEIPAADQIDRSGTASAETTAQIPAAGQTDHSRTPSAETTAQLPAADHIGRSGTASSHLIAAGNIAPSLGSADLLAHGAWLQEYKRDITGDAVDDASDEIINGWSAFKAKLHIDFSATGAGTVANGSYGMPYNIVPSSQPALPIAFSPYVSDPGPVPIPPLGSYEGMPPLKAPPSAPPNGSDRHCLILVRNATTGGFDTLWELYNVYSTDGGANWVATQGSKFDLATGAPRPYPDQPSADAGGGPILPILLKYEEVARGDVGHVIRATFPIGVSGSKYVWPARHSILSGGKLNMGARMRLRKDWYDANKSSFSGHARIILDAMRKYGIIHCDITGGGMGYGPFIGGVTDDRWDADSTTHGIFALQSVPVSAFEVVKQQPQYTISGPSSGPVGQWVGPFTVSKWPPADSNYSGAVYLYLNDKAAEWNGTRGTSKAAISLNNETPSGDFNLYVDQPGTYSIRGNHGNQVWLDAPPFTFTAQAP